MASRKVESIAGLQKELSKMILSAMNDIAKSGERTLKDHIENEVYSHRPIRYVRTKQLLNSTTHDVFQTGDFTTARIFNDHTKIKSYAPSYANKWMGQHHSTVKHYNPQEYNFFLVETINDGTSGHIFGEGFWTKPRPFFSKAKVEIEASFKKNFREGCNPKD